jgi:uncharacterized protein YbbC (DUF1343 family)
VRFYTYLSTLANVMQAAAAHALPVLILDRPVFLGGEIIEGGLLDPEYASFVGLYPLPIRYGMTSGEIALLLNQEFGIGCELRVVPMRNWQRGLWFDQTGLPFVPPSPNLPTLSAIQLYPGTCLIEGTNLSEGRGTTRPFEYIGAPWIHAEPLARDLNALNLEGVRFRPVYFVPTFSKYQGEHCAGVHLYVTDRQRFRPVQTVLRMIEFIKSAYPDTFGWKEPWSAGSKLPIDLLSGSALVRRYIDEGKPVRELLAQWDTSLVAFQGIREHYLLYGSPDFYQSRIR